MLQVSQVPSKLCQGIKCCAVAEAQMHDVVAGGSDSLLLFRKTLDASNCAEILYRCLASFDKEKGKWAAHQW